jgi:predicted metalloprotease
MRWRQGRLSRNVEDRRGMRATPVRLGGLGLGGLVLILLLGYLSGSDPIELLTDVSQLDSDMASAPTAAGAEPEDEAGRFASTILADTEDTWSYR